MLRKLVGGRKAHPHHAQTAQEFATLCSEGVALERGLAAMDKVMDGQIAEAQQVLSQSDSPYQKIAVGVLHFLEASVGMEVESVRNAIHHLGVAEASAHKAQDASTYSGLQTSSFRPGAQYELVHIEASLLSAVCMFLTESLIDAAKALYKLRKTYVALEDLRKHVSATQVVDWDHRYNKEASSNGGADMVGLDEFRKAHTARMAAVHQREANPKQVPEMTEDEYVISGVQACAGLLNIILSSVPPNLVKLLSIVGFHGDRALGLKMLWSTVETYGNVHSCLSLIVLIMFFDGPSQFSDIQLSIEEEAQISRENESDIDLDKKTTASMTPADLQKTRERLRVSLLAARKQYPHGVLWLLFWGRMVAQTDLVKGVEILSSDECGPNQMKQIEGLLVFDKTMMLLSLHKYQEASDNFIQLLELSTWSHSLYYYMAGGCELELYRLNKVRDPTVAASHKAKANEYFAKAPTMIGKKKFLAKTMPFDNFVVRKCKQMQAVAAAQGLELADAAGTSPLHEASYFWSVHARTPKELLPESLALIAYSADAPLKETSSEKFTRDLLTSYYLRLDGQVDAGLQLISTLIPQVIQPATPAAGEKVRYHKQAEPWAGPVTLYERAVFAWVANGIKSGSETRHWLKLTADWEEDYELSTRVNMRITAATDRLDIYRLH